MGGRGSTAAGSKAGQKVISAATNGGTKELNAMKKNSVYR